MSIQQFVPISYIGGQPVEMDREAIYDILTALSELHGRICSDIGTCGDMERANQLASRLFGVTQAYNHVERAAAEIDDRDERPIVNGV